MPNAREVLVYIKEDGSVRELTEADKKYVDTEFSPFDGARPYIKLNYSQRTALGEIRGYLPRTEVPEGMPINPAPSEHEPEHQTSQTVAELICRFELPPETVLVEHNGVALHRREWPQKSLTDGDRIEIIRVVAGG